MSEELACVAYALHNRSACICMCLHCTLYILYTPTASLIHCEYLQVRILVRFFPTASFMAYRWYSLYVALVVVCGPVLCMQHSLV